MRSPKKKDNGLMQFKLRLKLTKEDIKEKLIQLQNCDKEMAPTRTQTTSFNIRGNGSKDAKMVTEFY